MKPKKVRGDKLVLALISAFRTLMLWLSCLKKGVIDQDEFVALLQQSAITPSDAQTPPVRPGP